MAAQLSVKARRGREQPFALRFHRVSIHQLLASSCTDRWFVRVVPRFLLGWPGRKKTDEEPFAGFLHIHIEDFAASSAARDRRRWRANTHFSLQGVRYFTVAQITVGAVGIGFGDGHDIGGMIRRQVTESQ